jgi:hypothetical protein
VAYNHGGRLRRSGRALWRLDPTQAVAFLTELEPPEWEALLRLGPDGFERWALRGWSETPDMEAN